MRRAVLIAVLLALGAPAAAHAAPILSEEDATELAQSLADAQEAQGVCYGWRVTVDDQSGGGLSGEEVGSSLGPGRALATAGAECRQFVELVGGVLYTSELAEAEDQAEWDISSSLGRPPTLGELGDLGWTADDLLGDADDTALLNAVGALPALVADHGEAKAVPFEPAPRPAGVSGVPTGDQGNDFLRENKFLLAICALLIAGGLLWMLSTRPRPHR